MNHQCSGWSRVADSTPARIVGKSASRVLVVRIMSNYRRKIRICNKRIHAVLPSSKIDEPDQNCTGGSPSQTWRQASSAVARHRLEKPTLVGRWPFVL